MVMREQVELRAYQIWQEAGCPDGSSVVHWLQAEYELGVIPDARDVAGFARLDEVATAAKADDGLPTSSEAAVPQFMPDTTILEGGDSVRR